MYLLYKWNCNYIPSTLHRSGPHSVCVWPPACTHPCYPSAMERTYVDGGQPKDWTCEDIKEIRWICYYNINWFYLTFFVEQGRRTLHLFTITFDFNRGARTYVKVKNLYGWTFRINWNEEDLPIDQWPGQNIYKINCSDCSVHFLVFISHFIASVVGVFFGTDVVKLI